MALRVLLADESVTIKKVFQLTLQDYAVEVSTVTVGVDVVQVATIFKPDIIFVDVILQKKNGYDVCRELKSHPQFAATPIVLIWSGFMELDNAKYQACGANDNLEKPFDAQRLRAVVSKWVQKAGSQSLAKHLTFPKLPDFEEKISPVPLKQVTPAQQAYPPVTPAQQAYPPTPLHPDNIPTGSWSMESFAPIETPALNLDAPTTDDSEPAEDFLTIQLPTDSSRPKMRSAPPPLSDDDDNANTWVQKPLDKYKLAPNKQVEAEDEDSVFELDLQHNENEDLPLVDSPVPTRTVTKSTPSFHHRPEADLPPPIAPAAPSPSAKNISPLSALTAEQLEAIIRAQSQEVIEKVVWQVVPEIATRIIERELSRLLSERSKL